MLRLFQAVLAETFGQFGTVLAVTLRERREVKDGKQMVSWAIISFRTAEGAQKAIDATADLSRQYDNKLVMKTLDEDQVVKSTGQMGHVMRKHVQQRMQHLIKSGKSGGAAGGGAAKSTRLAASDNFMVVRLRLRAEAIDESGPNARILFEKYGQKGKRGFLEHAHFVKMVKCHGFTYTKVELDRMFKQ